MKTVVVISTRGLGAFCRDLLVERAAGADAVDDVDWLRMTEKVMGIGVPTPMSVRSLGKDCWL
jgi:hypothetical protein